MDLFIVESPGKVKKIQSYLGNGFKVSASLGHVRDLPSKEMGIEFESWKLQYELTDKGKGVFKTLNQLAKNANRIYLATDLDREGEAIAWHLAQLLRIPKDKIYRVKYNEITKDAVLAAVKSPGPIDINLVRAQEARRALDRLVGYTVSPAVSNSLKLKLSAGRVQSVALRLVVDRYRANKSFVPVDFFGAVLKFDGFSADWYAKPYFVPGENYNFDRSLAQEAADVTSVEVAQLESKQSVQKPQAPFTSSTMQQAAVKQLGINTETAMKLAQELYEAALITYHRTDSVELSSEAISSIREYATSKNYPLPDEPNVFKSKAGAQEAHEAIRPVDINCETASNLSESADALYKLIHKQALLSQLRPATFKKKTIVFKSEDGRFEYQVKGSTTIDPGFLSVSQNVKEDVELPNLTQGQTLNVISGEVKEQKTKAPPLFDEASLLNELERLGIGRPSTWASIIKILKVRSYILIEKKKFIPSETGLVLRDALEGFGFMEYSFTNDIEDQMDDIASGKDNYQACVTRVFRSVLTDMRSRFNYDGDGESFFVPQQRRDFVPTEKQIDAVKKMASALSIEIDEVNLASGQAVSEFIEKNYAAYKKTFKPTEKQIAYAQEIAGATGQCLSAEQMDSMVSLSAFIEKHIGSGKKKKRTKRK